MKPTLLGRIPFFATAYQVTEENLQEIAAWCQGHVIDNDDRPFVRVPVIRPTHNKQTQAYVNDWVVATHQKGEKSFKVYTDEWLWKQFYEMPADAYDNGTRGLAMKDEKKDIPRPANVHPIPVQFRSSSTSRAAAR